MLDSLVQNSPYNISLTVDSTCVIFKLALVPPGATTVAESRSMVLHQPLVSTLFRVPRMLSKLEMFIPTCYSNAQGSPRAENHSKTPPETQQESNEETSESTPTLTPPDTQGTNSPPARSQSVPEESQADSECTVYVFTQLIHSNSQVNTCARC